MGNLWGGVASHCKLLRHSAVSSAKTAEPIEMQFAMLNWVVPGKHVLDVGV